MKAIFPSTVERWDVFEVCVEGPTSGNPFTDAHIIGTFRGKNEVKAVEGFYDGDGVYKVRFMPSFEGEYTFLVRLSWTDEAAEGAFVATAAGENNHGPVRVAQTYHFAYEDGTPYRPLGTTCYVWNHQSDALQAQTLQTLRENAFNKIRFCVFPKHYDYNLHEPQTYPYVGTPCDSSAITSRNFQRYNGRAEGNDWDFSRFNPEHFRRVESCIARLRDLGIEADLIIMHPYDRWGFSQMDAESDDLYWKYVIARFAAYRNVWWSLANEYDLFPTKTVADWERFAGLLCERDPYNHLRSIHNCLHFYDYSRPWVTHCSIQRIDLYKSSEMVNEWRMRYRKPIVLDEIAYEGNIQHGWGNISPREMTRRFWEGFCRGAYPGHGETYLHPEGILWWSHGGQLHGESPARIRFLARIANETPGIGVEPWDRGMFGWDEVACRAAGLRAPWEYCMFYYSFMRPSFREFHFDDVTDLRVEVIDTWNMTIEDRGVFRGEFRVDLPGREYMAIRIRKAD